MRIGIMAIVGVFLILAALSFALSTDEDYKYTHTKAICEGNSCQDFLIVCSGNEFVEMSALTGLVTFSDGWKDPRNEEEKELC